MRLKNEKCVKIQSEYNTMMRSWLDPHCIGRNSGKVSLKWWKE
jgi:hypothetical protein